MPALTLQHHTLPRLRSALSSMAALCLCLGLLASCKRDAQAPQTAVAMADAAALAAAVAQPPWLRDRLPEDSFAYLRVPSTTAMLAFSNGRPSDAIFSNAPQVEAVAKIREAIIANARLAELSGGVLPLLAAIDGPVEVALYAQGRLASPAANVFASMQLRSGDPAQVARLLAGVLDEEVVAPEFDGAGKARIELGSTTVFLHFDAEARRLSLLGGLFAHAGSLDELMQLTAKARTAPHTLLALEGQIDTSGQGLVVLLDGVALRPLLTAGLQPEQAWLRPWLEALNSVALGWGSVDGSGRVALWAGLEQPPGQDWMPPAVALDGLTTAGQPDYLVAMGLPAAGQLLASISTLLSMDPDLSIDAARLDQLSLEHSGMSVSDWLAPFAGPLVGAMDRAGSWSAVRLRDEAALQEWVQRLVAQGGQHAERSWRGHTIHHLSLARRPMAAEARALLGSTEALMQDLVEQAPAAHLYWYVEHGWMYAASIPQPLMARLALGAQTPAGDYQSRILGQDATRAAFTAASSLNGLGPLLHDLVLQMTQFGADLSGARIDMFSLPTSADLALPAQTPIGLAMELGQQRAGLYLSYDQLPFEGIGGGGLGTAAAAGILLAIAIPAYQDYTARASVDAALLESLQLQQAIADHWLATEELPESLDAVRDSATTVADGAAELDIDGGAIRISFTATAPQPLAGSYLYLLPAVDDAGELTWLCGPAAMTSNADRLVSMREGVPASDLKPAHLPQRCR